MIFRYIWMISDFKLMLELYVILSINLRLLEKYLILLWSHDIHVTKIQKKSSSIQADLRRKGQKDGVHINLIVTIGASESKFGMLTISYQSSDS